MPTITNWKLLHSIADETEQSVREAWESGLDSLRDRITDDTAELLILGTPPHDLIRFDEVETELMRILTSAYLRDAERLRTFADWSWLELLQADDLSAIGANITGIGGAHLEMIQNVIDESVKAGQSPYRLARDLRDVVGLSPSQERALRNYRNSFMDEDGNLKVSPEEARRLEQRRLEQMRKYRAEMIARTETMNALNLAQLRQWETMGGEGLLPDQAKKVWITTPDDRLCERCKAFNGVKANVSDSFRSKRGETALHPPLHPMCRCAMGLEIVDVDMDYVQDLLDNGPIGGGPLNYDNPWDAMMGSNLLKNMDKYAAMNGQSKYARMLEDLLAERGHDGIPLVCDILGEIAAGNKLPAFRGVKNDAYLEQFLNGGYFAGGGMHGTGTYIAVDGSQNEHGMSPEDLARAYAGLGDATGIIEMAYPADAKIMTKTMFDRVVQDAYGYFGREGNTGDIMNFLTAMTDPGFMAGLMGYDAYQGAEGEMTWIRRDKLCARKKA